MPSMTAALASLNRTIVAARALAESVTHPAHLAYRLACRRAFKLRFNRVSDETNYR